MQHHKSSIDIHAPIEQVFAFHADTNNLVRISPPGVRMEILSVEGEKGPGQRVRLRMTKFGLLRATLLVEFVEYDAPYLLGDVQREGPFKQWVQRREFQRIEGGTRLTDSVEYQAPFGAIGRIAERFFMAGRIRSMFDYRQQRTKELIEAEHRLRAD